MFSALPSTTDGKATILVSLVPLGSSYSFRPPKWVSFLEKLEFLCANEPHRSPCSKRQRFDHPHPRWGFAYGRFGSKSDLDARNSNVCFNPMNRHHQLEQRRPKSAKSGLMRANSIAYGGDEELDKPREDRSTLPIENQSFVSSGEGVFIPAFSFPGFDSIPGVLLAKHRPKFPTALRGLLAKPLLKQDR
jgi:hypothetical protein